MRHHLHRFAYAISVALLMQQPLQANSGPSEVSAALSELSVVPAWSTGMLIIGAGEMVLVGLQASAAGAEAVLESAVDGSRFSVEVSADLLAHAGALSGRAVVAISEVAGTSLMVGGELLLFVPSAVLAGHHHRDRID